MKPQIWSLDHLIDIAGLEELHLEICRGIAMSNRDLSTRLVPHLEMTKGLDAALAFKNKEPPRIYSVSDDARLLLSEEELEAYLPMTYNQKRTFLEVYKGAYTDGEFIRIRFTQKEHLLRPYSTFHSNQTEWTENAQHFPRLLSWINKLPFSDIGRILIFLTKHHLHGDIHYDRRDHWLDGRHHFLWLNPFGQKKFYLYDGNQPIHVTSKAAFFDTSYLHGTSIHETTVYSLRIDGQLNQEICNQVGIPWSPR
jgi:hypothetical protein